MLYLRVQVQYFDLLMLGVSHLCKFLNLFQFRYLVLRCGLLQLSFVVLDLDLSQCLAIHIKRTLFIFVNKYSLDFMVSFFR